MNTKGVYIHIPFCASKCPYCDFYSSVGNTGSYDEYTESLIHRIYNWGEKLSFSADTLYFGGGTPGLLGADRLVRIADAVRSCFGSGQNEITAEINPSNEGLDLFMLRKHGFDRLSIGLQSAVESELEFLGRKHSAADAAKRINAARAAGFDNISLDLMISLQGQTNDSLKRSVNFCAENHAEHISAYILKIEPGTVFYKHRSKLQLPDDDQTADIYEYLCSLMREYGYNHYEISNFCLPGHEGQHNLKYWHDEEYLGIGPSAHSFINGQRFFYPRKMQDFLSDVTVPDGSGGTVEEYIMLNLRLSEGLKYSAFRKRFGRDIQDEYRKNAEKLSGTGLISTDENGFALTEKGFLVSNAVIGRILSE